MFTSVYYLLFQFTCITKSILRSAYFVTMSEAEKSFNTFYDVWFVDNTLREYSHCFDEP